MNNKNMIGGMMALFAIFLLLWVGYFVYSGGSTTSTPDNSAVVLTPVASTPATEVANVPAQLPPPVVEALPTNTPIPTATATSTPLPTETPLPTDTPAPTATAVPPTAKPIVILPTAVPPTAVPPTAVPVNTRGLTAGFSVEGGAIHPVNSLIWFNFNISNSSGGDVPFGGLGVFPRKNGADRLDLFQFSWSNEKIPANGLTWRDHIDLHESGSYTLRLAICFDADLNGCRAGGGSWVTLSPEVAITVP